jgi:Ca2+-binding RTX toxin-like protein
MFSFRFARPRRSSTTPKRRRLNFEPLEDRRLLTVSYSNSGGAYTITSTSSADDVRVVAPGIGDLNFDGIVNGLDSNAVATHWLGAGPAGDGNYDGIVNGLDSNLISSHWLQSSQIEVFNGGTQVGSSINLSAITSLAINADGGTIEIDGNFSRPVTVDGGSNATLDINGNPNRGDTVSMTDSSITLFDSATTVSYSNIENINFALGGTSGSDLLTINGTSGDDSMQAQSDGSTIVFNGLNVNVASVEGLTLNGNDGNDSIDMFYLNSAIALTINGGNGDDLLAGGAGNDAINGGAGNNTLIGWGGNDTLNGGSGSATFLYMPGPANLGTDTLSIDSGGVGTLDFEYLTDGVTVNIGSTSTQNVVSGLLSLNLGTSTTIANVIGGAGNDNITGNSLSNVLDGRDGDDTITAGTGNAVMYGGNGDDTLTGGSGNDLLYGGAGDDALAGGGGNDTYLFPWSPGDDPLGTDTITEASSAGTDKLDFSNFFPATYSAPSLSSTSTQTVGTDSSSNPVLAIHLVNASTIESKSDSPSSPPAIGAVAIDTSSTPGTVNISAVDTDPNATKVDFYLDTNRDGIYESGTDTSLGSDSDGTDGWSISVAANQLPTGLVPILAIAENSGVLQTPATAATAIISPLLNTGALSGTGGGGGGGADVGGPTVPPPTYGAPTLFRTDTVATYVQTNGGVNANTISDNPDPLSLDSEVSNDFDAIDAIAGTLRASDDDGSTIAMAQFTGAAKRSIWTQPGLGVAGLLQTLTSATSTEAAGGGALFSRLEGFVPGNGAVASSGDSGQSQTWEVDANGAKVNGVAVTSVTIAGSITYLWQDNQTESGSGATAALDAFTISISSEGGAAALNGGQGNTTVTVNGTPHTVAGSANSYSISVPFTMTVPVGSEVDVNYVVSHLDGAGANDDSDNPSGSATSGAQQMYVLGASIVGWS